MLTTDLGACEWFVWDLRRSNLIDRGQLDQVIGEFLSKNPTAEPPLLAEFLVQKGYLTEFQAERLLQGKTQGFVGSELEALVIEARNTAFNERNTGNPTFDELFAAANDLVPMSTRDAASIDEIRKFCEGKAEPVCDTALSGTVPPGRLQGRVIESN